MTHAPESPGIRLDIWLWAARFYKTRALAKHAIEGGKVDVQGQGAKPSRLLKTGDALRLARGEDVFEVQVVGLSGKRGTAAAAQSLYLETNESRETRLRLAAERRAANAGYRAPPGKPDKRARRLIQALGDLDTL